MTVTINGTTGVAGVDGTAGTPSYQGNDSNTGIFFPAADTIAFAEGGAEVSRFDSAGNLGIGTTTPNKGGVPRAVTLNSSGGNIVEFCVSESRIGWVYGDGNLTAVAAAGSRYIALETNGTQRMRVNGVGSLEYSTYNSGNIYAGDATITLSGSTVTFDLVTLFPGLVGNGAGMGIMLLINQWSGAPNSGITQLTLGQKSSGWTFSTIASTGSGTGSSVSGSGTVITVTSGAGFGQVRVWVTSRN
jgi:hypothetical protein